MELVTVTRILLLHPEIWDLDMAFPPGQCHSCGAVQPDGEDWDLFPAWVSYRHTFGRTPPTDPTALVIVPVDEVALVTLCPTVCAARAVADAEWQCVPFGIKVEE